MYQDSCDVWPAIIVRDYGGGHVVLRVLDDQQYQPMPVRVGVWPGSPGLYNSWWPRAQP